MAQEFDFSKGVEIGECCGKKWHFNEVGWRKYKRIWYCPECSKEIQYELDDKIVDDKH